MTLLRWLTFLLRSQTVILTALLFWIYLFLLTLVFVLQWLPLHWEILIMLLSQFLLTFYQIHNKISYLIAYDYSCADWDGLCDHLRDVPWVDIFKLGASGIDVYIPHCKYQIKPYSSPWFSAACVAAIVQRNHFSFVPTE